MTGDDFPMAPRLRVMRIILLALCMGVFTFAVIAIFLRQAGAAPPPPVPVISYVAYGYAAITLLLSAVVPNTMAATWRKRFADRPAGKDDEGTWWGLYQTRLIIQAALIEGAAFFQLVAYIIEGQPISLGVGLGLLACLLFLFPTRDRVETWVRTQRDLVGQPR